MMLDILEANRKLGNGKESPAWSGAGLGNTNPIATHGPALFPYPALRTSPPRILEALSLAAGSPSLGRPTLFQSNTLIAQATLSGQGGMSAQAEILPRARVLKPAAQVILFQKIMVEWDFTDQEAATLLGFEPVTDIRDIYLGTKPVGNRDANDRLRTVLRVGTDLDALFEKVAAIRDWLSEPQRDLNDETPRSLLTEGSMEKLLRIKYYVAYLSGR